MEQCYLMPGQERCEKIKDANGVPKVSYSYRSLQGAFFHCVSRSVEEAQSRCKTTRSGSSAATRATLPEQPAPTAGTGICALS